MAAFAHEIRTPLTALNMALDLAARNPGVDGSLEVDAEIAVLIRQSLEAMERLVDDLEETSRLHRGKAPIRQARCELPIAVEAARELLYPRITLDGPEAPPVGGPWDAAQLARAVAAFAESADRMGDGCGAVQFEATAGPANVTLRFASGSPGGAAQQVASDAGFAFFHARQHTLALGGSVHVQRADQFARLTVTLPANPR
jgi:K+-sensing histidine kinase KdpD